jgi:hypothetical protein
MPDSGAFFALWLNSNVSVYILYFCSFSFPAWDLYTQYQADIVSLDVWTSLPPNEWVFLLSFLVTFAHIFLCGIATAPNWLDQSCNYPAIASREKKEETKCSRVWTVWGGKWNSRPHIFFWVVIEITIFLFCPLKSMENLLSSRRMF